VNSNKIRIYVLNALGSLSEPDADFLEPDAGITGPNVFSFLGSLASRSVPLAQLTLWSDTWLPVPGTVLLIFCPILFTLFLSLCNTFLCATVLVLSGRFSIFSAFLWYASLQRFCKEVPHGTMLHLHLSFFNLVCDKVRTHIKVLHSLTTWCTTILSE